MERNNKHCYFTAVSVNERRRQFLTDIRSNMENYLIKDMPEYIKRYLAIECPANSLWRRTVWKKFVNHMGITDSSVLNVSPCFFLFVM